MSAWDGTSASFHPDGMGKEGLLKETVIHHCLSLIIIWHSPLYCHFSLSIVSNRFSPLLSAIPPLSIISNYLSFPIVCFPLFVIPHCLPFPWSAIFHCLLLSFIWYSPLSNNFHCLSFPIVDHSQCLLFTIFCYIPLSVIPHGMSFHIVCHLPLSVMNHRLTFTIVCVEPLFVIYHCLC